MNKFIYYFTLLIVLLNSCSPKMNEPFDNSRYILETYKPSKLDSNSLFTLLPFMLIDSVYTVAHDSLCNGKECNPFTYNKETHVLTIDEASYNVIKGTKGRIVLVSKDNDTVIFKPSN